MRMTRIARAPHADRTTGRPAADAPPTIRPMTPLPRDHTLTAPPAPRPTPVLVARHVATVLYFPLHVVVIFAVFAAYLAFTLCCELLSWIPKVETAWGKLSNRFLDALPLWPRWFVSYPELRHEGDAAFYRARLERTLGRWQRGAGGNLDNKTHTLHVHKYRALSADEALRTAAARGFRPYGADAVVPGRRIRFHRPEAAG